MNQIQDIAYYFSLAFVSVSFITLIIFLIFRCKRISKPVQSEEITIPEPKSYARTYQLMEIEDATDSFSDRRIIGRGRLGTVYGAVLPGGDVVAVKRIHPRLVLSNAGLGFRSVMRTISLARHANIAPLRGFSQAPGERIIVMEYVGNLSLNHYLHGDSDRAPLLDWSHRVRIAAGVARGIEYLHEKMAPSVVHGCIKPSNVLLDADFGPKLCDYGLSFFTPKEKTGISGYVDGEYCSEGACKESDVYGLGVVLLEMVSGRRSEQGLLVKWALPLVKEMRFGEVLDPRLVIPSDIKPIVRLAKVAIACTCNYRKDRPSISQVMEILNNLEGQL